MPNDLIALSGYAQTGKDTVAVILGELYGHRRTAFADALRTGLCGVDPWLAPNKTAWRPWRRRLPYRRLSDLWVALGGYDGVKASAYSHDLRVYQQRYGTEGGRHVHGEECWVSACFRAMDQSKPYVIADCRFPNEAEAVRDRAGQVWRINRPGVGPATDHISEIAIDDYPFDVVITNDGDLASLKSKVMEAWNG